MEVQQATAWEREERLTPEREQSPEAGIPAGGRRRTGASAENIDDGASVLNFAKKKGLRPKGLKTRILHAQDFTL